MIKSLLLFVLAGLAEIGGGYLIWLWIREKKHIFLGIAGGIILVLYGVIPTLQEYPNFGRVYAAYGGIFIILSLLWGWGVDKKKPDFYDWLGSFIALVGAAIIIWTPR
ncbi:YnfA family protein [Desulforamulus aeronauticus]|uniref:Small multidrug resistance family-3 protein n=1 Tax=Desulforamulus aeronauticus DSM 10349 TaxID=1121421 RepID=A0A1M6SQH1_9FIRM|nr:YnfA family protein [Desulforamulus aeronauticus]SHK46935.1 small multidrug resistance family-3 protein [Desulforamulus aeronauticus DSM 10349]